MSVEVCAICDIAGCIHIRERQARKAAPQYTICDDCGNNCLEHDKAIWTADGASYCPACRPHIAPEPPLTRADMFALAVLTGMVMREGYTQTTADAVELAAKRAGEFFGGRG